MMLVGCYKKRLDLMIFGHVNLCTCYVERTLAVKNDICTV